MNANILIVEDEPFLRRVISQECREKGYNVDNAADGEEALSKAKEGSFDLILLDLVLPSIDGFEVLAQLKKQPETKNVPVIIISNLAQREEIEKGLSLGADDYLIKANVTPSEIVERIEKLLEKCKKQ